MNSIESLSGAPNAFPADDLSRLELFIAQRADRLAQSDGCERGRDLEHWLQAESEVFGQSQADAATATVSA